MSTRPKAACKGCALFKAGRYPATPGVMTIRSRVLILAPWSQIQEWESRKYSWLPRSKLFNDKSVVPLMGCPAKRNMVGAFRNAKGSHPDFAKRQPMELVKMSECGDEPNPMIFQLRTWFKAQEGRIVFCLGPKVWKFVFGPHLNHVPFRNVWGNIVEVLGVKVYVGSEWNAPIRSQDYLDRDLDLLSVWARDGELGPPVEVQTKVISVKKGVKLLKKWPKRTNIAADLETEIGAPWRHAIKTVAFASEVSRAYTIDIERAVKHGGVKTQKRLEEFFDLLLNRHTSIWHNARFDLKWIWAHYGVYPRNHKTAPHCTLLLHRNKYENPTRHDLGSACQQEFLAGAWKGDHNHGDGLGKKALLEYNGYDAAYTLRLFYALTDKLEITHQSIVGRVAKMKPLTVTYHSYDQDRSHLYMGTMLTRNGMPVDHGRAWQLYSDAYEEVMGLKADLANLAPSLRPSSPVARAKFIYNELKLLPPKDFPATMLYTKSGNKAATKQLLIGWMRGFDREDEEYQILRKMVQFSTTNKKLSECRSVLSPGQFQAACALERSKAKHNDVLWGDGLFHPIYSPHALTGRYTSQAPNGQNQKHAKSVYRRPGYVWVYYDFDQIHIRIQANVWRIKRYLHAFSTGECPHLLGAAIAMSREVLEAAPGFVDMKTKPDGKTPAGKFRQLGKLLNFLTSYGAGARVLWVAIATILDKQSHLVFKDFPLVKAQKMLENKKKNEPEWEIQYKKYATAHKVGRLCDPISKRHFKVPSGKPTEINNFPVLSAEQSIASIAMRRIIALYPHYFSNQVHDSIALLVPIQKAEEIYQRVGEVMPVEIKGHEVPYTVEGGIFEDLSCLVDLRKEPGWVKLGK